MSNEQSIERTSTEDAFQYKTIINDNTSQNGFIGIYKPNQVKRLNNM